MLDKKSMTALHYTLMLVGQGDTGTAGSNSENNGTRDRDEHIYIYT